jgi:hypothetical protein
MPLLFWTGFMGFILIIEITNRVWIGLEKQARFVDNH